MSPNDIEAMARLAQELAKMAAERDALRLIVTERLAEHGLTVKAEDAADVARWVEHPDAVRELLKADQLSASGYEYDLNCTDCDAFAHESHQRVGVGQFGAATDWTKVRDCHIAAAWRALGDPRGTADIERAHEEALREQMRRAVHDGPRYRAAKRHSPPRTPGHEWTELHREESDARGMEAVEDEARDEEARRPGHVAEFGRHDALDDSTLMCPCGSSITWSGFDDRVGEWRATHVVHLVTRAGRDEASLARSAGREPFVP